MHKTILFRGQDPMRSVERCTVCCIRYHCAYCKSVYAHLHQLQNHVASHMENAVQQEGMWIILIIPCVKNMLSISDFACHNYFLAFKTKTKNHLIFYFVVKSLGSLKFQIL